MKRKAAGKVKIKFRTKTGKTVSFTAKGPSRRKKRGWTCNCCGASASRGLCDKCAFGKCPKGKKH